MLLWLFYHCMPNTPCYAVFHYIQLPLSRVTFQADRLCEVFKLTRLYVYVIESASADCFCNEMASESKQGKYQYPAGTYEWGLVSSD